MSETKETTPDKTLRSGARKPLSLKRTEPSGHVQQSFSHGRKNVVVVERKKRRTIAAPGQGDEEGRGADSATAQKVAERPREGALRQDELDARKRALAANREREAVEAEEREREGRRLQEEQRTAEAERGAQAEAEISADAAVPSIADEPVQPQPDALKGQPSKVEPAVAQEAGQPARGEARKADPAIARRLGRPVVE